LREVVSKQIAVGATDAELVLEFNDGERLAAALRDGSVLVDDRTLGSFESGDALDASWRALLGQANALENGTLAQAVVDWAPPESLSGGAAAAAGGVVDEGAGLGGYRAAGGTAVAAGPGVCAARRGGGAAGCARQYAAGARADGAGGECAGAVGALERLCLWRGGGCRPLPGEG